MFDSFEFDGEIGILFGHYKSLPNLKRITPAEFMKDVRDNTWVVKALYCRQHIIRTWLFSFFNFVGHFTDLSFLFLKLRVLAYYNTR